MIKKEQLVPAQHTGEESNTEKSLTCTNTEEAKRLFQQLKKRLFNINAWHEYAGALTADFKHCDKQGNEVYRAVETGDHFKIDIPGPGSATGDGYDWVKVEAVENTSGAEKEVSLIKVRPATNPTNDKPDVAHFFDNSATSSFIVAREGNTLTAGVYGRNEQPNTSAEGIIDKIRNSTVAAGAISAFSKFQWKSLVDGLLDVK